MENNTSQKKLIEDTLIAVADYIYFKEAKIARELLNMAV